MKFPLVFTFAMVAVGSAVADGTATSLAFDTHSLLESADSSADKVITAMDNVAQAIAAADDKLQQIIAKAKAGVKKNQKGAMATVKADYVTLSHKAAKAMSSPGGFDWSQFVPNKKAMGKPTSKVVNMGDASTKAAPAAASSSPSESSPGGYDWSKWAPKDTSGGSFNKAPSGVLLANNLKMTPETVAAQASSMSDSAADAASALADKLTEAAEKLKAASAKLKEKAAEAKAAMGSSDSDSAAEDAPETTASLRTPTVAHNYSSVAPTVLGLIVVGSAVAGVILHRRNRHSYERL